MSSRSCDYLGRVLDGREYFAGDVAFETADDLGLGQPLSGAPIRVCDGTAIVAKPHENDAIESRVRLAIASPV